ncbi:AtuA-related protein, partial [Streptomyces iconiensis]|uniref:AtuA-related protein n=1 Tax=Streptomyces iconiensis TaxID=1384038 RepID=UPI003D2F7FE8
AGGRGAPPPDGPPPKGASPPLDSPSPNLGGGSRVELSRGEGRGGWWGALGEVVGARSGDKGGSANIGVWARDFDGRIWEWLRRELTVDRLRELLPEVKELPITRYELANLRALNFVIEDILGEGVASQARFDPQAKGLGEWLRSRHLEIPEELLT